MLENLKKNIRNKSWWVSVISLLIMLGQSHGVDLTKYIGTDWNATLNTIFGLAVLFGISVNTTLVNTSNVTENTIETDSNSTNTNVTNSSNSTDATTSTDNSASAKIKVDNPDNGVELDKTVNVSTAVKPN